MGRGSVGVTTDGLRDLRKALRRVSKDLDKAITAELRALANTIRDEARADAPRKTGALASSVKSSVKQRGASIYSNLEYAGVHEYGGTISPRGAPITIQGRFYIYGAIADKEDYIDDALGKMFDGVVKRSGFH